MLCGGACNVSVMRVATLWETHCLPNLALAGITTLTILVCARFHRARVVCPKEGPESGYNERKAGAAHAAAAHTTNFDVQKDGRAHQQASQGGSSERD